MSMPTQCWSCGERVIFCTVDVTSDPLGGVAKCLGCGAQRSFEFDVPSVLQQITFQVDGRPVPECGACPKCDSLNVGIVGDYFENEEENWLDFNCNDCKHGFKVTGPVVRKLLKVLSGDGLSPVPFSLN